MRKHQFLRALFVGALALGSLSTWANHPLPNQPLAADGKSYIVKWDCEKSTWCATNDMEYDETFVIAIDLSGTALATWLKGTAAVQGMVRAAALNVMRDDQGNEYADKTARMWRIRDDIYGAEVNFKQFAMKNTGTPNNNPGTGTATKIHARIFGVENGFGGQCNLPYIQGKTGKWWQWPTGWGEDYVFPDGGECLFVFAPYTGTKTSPIFTTTDKTGVPDIYYDKDHYVEANGYSAPCMFQKTEDDANCCPELEDLPTPLSIDQNADTMVVLNLLTRKSGDYTFQWYSKSSGGTWTEYTGSTTETLQIPTATIGTTTYKCKVTSFICPNGVESNDMQVTVNKVPQCPTFTWQVDGVEGLSTTAMYPGGWYMVSCTNEAGSAPTLTVSGTNVQAGTPQTSGNTTTIKVTLLGNATGDMTFYAANTTVSADWKACDETQTIAVGNCENGLAYRMTGFNNNGKYVIDNGGKVEMGTPANNNDMWQPITTGETFQGYNVIYLRNVGTGQYLYRGPVQLTGGSKGNLTESNLDYAEPLTSAQNAQTDDYKWFFLRDGDQDRYIYLMCKAGWSGNWQTSFALHNRNYDYWYCQGGNNQMCDLRVCNPEMKVGKLDNYTGSPETRMDNDPYNTNNWQFTEVYGAPEHIQTTIGWSSPAPASPVELLSGEEVTHLAARTDAIHSINTSITYTSADPNIATVDPATGKVTAVGGGTTTIKAELENVGCFDGDSVTYEVKVKGCSPFEWAIDGTAGLTTLMYPGGWYMLSCTTSDGAPDITVTGAGITTETAVKSGNTTTIEVILQGDASGDITLTASMSSGTLTCEDTQTIPVSACTETAAESRKIEWFNYKTSTKEWPQYWIHGGASVYLRDNNGVLEADIEDQDGNDQWYIIQTGEQCIGQDVFYMQNVQTQRYVYRGATHGNVGGDWEYAEALLNATNAQTDDYKWILYEHNGDTAIVNISGVTTSSNFQKDMYMLHVRNWEASTLFSNPNIPSPRMVCGKMADQGESPAFYFKGYTTTKPITPFQTQLKWKGTAPQDTIIRQQGTTFTFEAERADNLHSINKKISYESLDPTIATVDDNTGAVNIVASDGETTIRAILEEVGCFKSDTLYYVVKIFDCGLEPVISVSKTTLQRSEQIQISLTNPPAVAEETGAWVFSQNDGQNATITADGTFSATNVGTYKFYYKITNAVHAVCNRQSNELTITVRDKEDYILPHQPIGTDGEYIVLWDCDANDFATANTMEWGETFTFAVNLSGTPLGNWVMQTPTSPNGIRTIAFDRLLVKNGDDVAEHFDLDVSRLWLIRDTIFGATFNFKQIPLRNGQSFTPSMGAQTGIAARLFGVEAAHGDMCGNAPNVSLWWQWSNNSTYSEWGGEWQEGKYVSEDDQYLFSFAPYTGKSDPDYDAQVDDPRDRWYDNGHDFSNKGYSSPCPQAWPQDQILSLDTNTICDEKQETATLTLASSESGISYQLYQDGTAMGAATVGTGADLSWTISDAGTYTIEAISPVAGHNDWMGQCNGTQKQTVTIHCEVPPAPITYLKFTDSIGTHIWSDAKNWWPKYNRVPNDTDSVVIAAPCQVDVVNACAEHMTFTVNTGYDLTILPTGGLTVTGEITNAQPGDILIQSTAAGTGSFVYRNPTTPYPARVEFYCQAKDGGSAEPTWQYIGQPLSTAVAYSAQYTRPNTQIYIWDAQSDYSMGGLWYAVPASQTFAPFWGYCITQDQPTTYVYDGTLNAAKAQTLNVPCLAATDYPAFYLLSNSWTAPVRIADIEESAFNGVDATIYIMNTGTYHEALSQQGAMSATGQAKAKGQYNAIPVHAASYLPDALQVIPAMQGFFVHNNTTDGTMGTMTLDYEKAVYNSQYNLSNQSARTPVRRAAAVPDVQSLHLVVENAYWADGVDLLQSMHFTPHFDQGWDGHKMLGRNTAVSLSVQTLDGEMAVAALSDWDNVPLTLSCIKGLEYTFRFTTKNAGDWYLYDAATDTYTLLTDGGEYTFRANQSTESSRFYIRKGVTNTVEPQPDNLDGKYIIQGRLVIFHAGEWYDALGSKLK